MRIQHAGAPRSQQSRAVVKYVSTVVQRSAVSQSVVRERERSVHSWSAASQSQRDRGERDVLESSKAVR